MSPAATKLAQAKATPAPSIMMLADENGQPKQVKAKAKPASKAKAATKAHRAQRWQASSRPSSCCSSLQSECCGGSAAKKTGKVTSTAVTNVSSLSRTILKSKMAEGVLLEGQRQPLQPTQHSARQTMQKQQMRTRVTSQQQSDNVAVGLNCIECEFGYLCLSLLPNGDICI